MKNTHGTTKIYFVQDTQTGDIIAYKQSLIDAQALALDLEHQELESTGYPVYFTVKMQEVYSEELYLIESN